MKLIFLFSLILVVLAVALFVHQEGQPPTQTNGEFNENKDYIYIPIECMIDQNSYDVKCYEDYLNGN